MRNSAPGPLPSETGYTVPPPTRDILCLQLVDRGVEPNSARFDDMEVCMVDGTGRTIVTGTGDHCTLVNKGISEVMMLFKVQWHLLKAALQSLRGPRVKYLLDYTTISRTEAHPWFESDPEKGLQPAIDIHVNFPKWGIVKNAAHYGLGFAMALLSLGNGVKMRDDTMALGELTAGGAVSGMHKILDDELDLLSAAGNTKLIVPEVNLRALVRSGLIDEETHYRGSLKVIFVSTVYEAIRHVFRS